MRTSKPAKHAGGRPRTGPSGERVSDYPALTVRIPLATKQKLASLSALRRIPLWRLVDEAITAYFEGLPDEERRLLTQFAGRMATR
jgi:hypothetical protein